MIADYISILRESSIFSDLSMRDIEQVLENSVFQVISFEKGDLIAQGNTAFNHSRIILKGKIAGEMMDLSGKVLKIEDLGPSKLIAPAFLYGRRRQYPVNVVASENTVLWQMHRDEFSKLLQRDLRLLNNYLNAISNRAQFLSEKIRFLSFPNLKAKLAFLFIQYSNGETEFKLPLTHQQMSELFGVARPSLSREIRLMNSVGLIDSDREMIRILDFKGLKALLDED